MKKLIILIGIISISFIGNAQEISDALHGSGGQEVIKKENKNSNVARLLTASVKPSLERSIKILSNETFECDQESFNNVYSLISLNKNERLADAYYSEEGGKIREHNKHRALFSAQICTNARYGDRVIIYKKNKAGNEEAPIIMFPKHYCALKKNKVRTTLLGKKIYEPVLKCKGNSESLTIASIDKAFGS